ncbi:MAG: IS5 family transposase [Candidatus Jettenia sp. CY-1]|nr:MAG: IS5 family transposase [Candidatus Jettenia sp. CY-1]
MPIRKKSPQGGRPPADDRECFEGILWVLWIGAPWSELPSRYGSKSTVHRRLQEWTEKKTLEHLWKVFLSQLQEQEQIRWNECFIDGTFSSAKKGAKESEKPSGAREQSLWYWLMARVLRSEFTWTRASPSEVKLFMPTLATVQIKTHQPQRLIADKGYDSNEIRKRLKDRGIEPIIPARKNNCKATDQDGRKLHRYRSRRIVERTIAWLQNFRRLVVRYERSVTIYSALVHMACALIALKRVLG